MKLKKLFALFGALLLSFGACLLYISSNLRSTPDFVKDEEVKNNEWVHVKDHEVQKPQEKHDTVVIKRPHRPQPVVKHNATLNLQMIYSPTCPIQLDYIPQSTIQMLDVYNDLEFDNPDGGVWKQGWKIEVNDKMWNAQHKLKVFVVPHSHNDPGWIKTFDDYFQTETKHILDNMVEKLQLDVRRKFIWAEISYFAVWWNEIDESVRSEVRRLIENKQLEFVTGGWVMNDEANSHYIAIINQLTDGHQWLQQNLNYTPQHGWSIDPFGMSSTQAILQKGMGFKNMLIQRVHYSIKKRLASEKQLEFFWRQTWDGNGKTDIFTHMMPFYSYDIPHTCGPDPSICCQFDFKRLPGFGLSCPWRVNPQEITDENIAEKAEMLLDQYRKKSTLYKTNVLLVPLGDDFRYTQNKEWDVQYNNYQKLFDYINSKVYLNAHVKFGTLSDYFNAVRHETADGAFPSLSGDFFTYADRDDHYWSGYYTSRPFYKRMDRMLMAYIKTSESLMTLAMLNDNLSWINKLIKYDYIESYVINARRALSLFQHHDGITGTAKDHVVVDYGERMLSAIKDCQFVIQKCANILLSQEDADTLAGDTIYYNVDDVRTSHDALPEQYTITIGGELNTKRVVVYNSLAFERKEVVTFLVSTPFVEVLDNEQEFVKCQISPFFEYGATASSSKFYVSFVADIPALSLKGYTIRTVPMDKEQNDAHFAKIKIYNLNANFVPPTGFTDITLNPSSAEFTLQNSQVTASFSRSGLLKAIKIDSKTYPVHLDFAKYGVQQRNERSGAYLFLPDGDAVPIQHEDTTIRVIEGPIFSSVRVNVPYVDHTVYLYDTPGADGLGLEVHNLVDIKQTSNFEIVMRLSTAIKNDDVFFTDLNGYQVIRRRRFKKLPIQANYYPMPTTIFVEDSAARLTVLSGSAVGASSLAPGMVEVMMDRRLNQDDNRGLRQGVLDNHPTRHVFRILLEQRTHRCQTTADNHPAAFRSLAAHVALESLVNPVTRMLRTDDADDVSAQQFSYAQPPASLGVDYTLPVMMTGVKVKRNGHIGLVVHRTMLDLCFTNRVQLGRFPISNGSVSIHGLLPTAEFDYLTKSTLSFLKTEGKHDIRKPIELCPMELQAYIFTR